MEKFTIGGAEQPKKLKSFQLPVPGTQTKPTVIIGKAALNAYRSVFINTGVEQEDQPIGRSRLFNQPIYSDLTFQEGSYVDDSGNTVNYGPLQIDLVIMTVRNKKNVIYTDLQGRDGTVKEYISSGDYFIKIEIDLFGNGINNFPEQDFQKLIKICDAPRAVRVTSSFLKLFNVEDIVIDESETGQLRGVRNMQPATLYCYSDKPLILLKNA